MKGALQIKFIIIIILMKETSKRDKLPGGWIIQTGLGMQRGSRLGATRRERFRKGLGLLKKLRLFHTTPQVLKETLRLYPTAPGTSRDVMEDFVINGIPIPGGVSCMVSLC